MSLSKQDEDLLRQAPQSPEKLLKFLVEKLNWPLAPGMEPEDVEFLDWSPDDLHLDVDEIGHLKHVLQLPRLVADQQFGVFLLQFEGGKLPIGAVRRVVNRLVKRRRAQANVEHEQWSLEDLLFFCQSNEGRSVLHIVAFHEVDNNPVMRVISWASDSTDNRLDLINSQNLTALDWNGLSSVVADDLRLQLRSAFTSSYREGIKSSALLASRMAEVAKNVRDEVLNLYEVETEDGPLRQLFSEVKSTLNGSLDSAGFADMYAQTMVYGLLTSRITHPELFKAGEIYSVLRFDNPFLEALYEKFKSDGSDGVNVDEFGLHDLFELLSNIDIDEILADFGAGSHRDDPVVFFYEEFLQAYDPEQRKELGAYYTPIPVVRFMVDAVDSLIKSEFNLPLGVADTSTWDEYSKQHKINIPIGIDPTEPVIRALDPATGTGTFLLEWLRKAMQNLEEHKSLNDKNLSQVVNQLDAIEINLSSYSVANLKVGLELPPTVRATSRPRIRLADSLSARHGSFLVSDDPLTSESIAADEVKFDLNHSVVIGNPPYLRLSANQNSVQQMGGFVALPLMGPALLEEYAKPVREIGNGGSLKNIYNLFVYFWRFAEWKVTRRENSPAIVSFITASSYLKGAAFGGMRKSLRSSFDEIFIIDLGGEGRGARADHSDGNIFPIQTAVAICICVKRPQNKAGINPKQDSKVQYQLLKGSREDKLATLASEGFSSIDFISIAGSGQDVFIPSDTGKYGSSPRLEDLFPWQTSGAKLSRTWPISTEIKSLQERWNLLVDADKTEKVQLFKESRDRKISRPYPALLSKQQLTPINDLSPGTQPEGIQQYLYRSFDRQWVISDGRVGDVFATSLWKTKSEDQIFLICDLSNGLGSGQPAHVTTYIPDIDSLRGNHGARHVIPLYRSADLVPNFDPEVLKSISSIQGRDVSAIDVFNYCSGMLLGTNYSSVFREHLGVPGPRIPMTADSKLFERMSKLGAELVNAQTFKSDQVCLNDSKSQIKKKCVKSPTRLPIDRKDFTYDFESQTLAIADGLFSHVSQNVWEFETNGMRVLEKWISARTLRGSGKAASSSNPMDRIRPEEWNPDWTIQLEEILFALDSTLALRPDGIELLGEILDGQLIQDVDLPMPNPFFRKAPK